MKNTFKLWGITAVIAVIAIFSIASCKDPTQSDDTCTVTFNANGGSGTAPAKQTVDADSSITLPSGSGLSKSGSTFGGWNTKADGTGTNYAAGSSYTVTGDITLYAKWNISQAGPFYVTFSVNGGSGTAPSSQFVQSGSSITFPSGSGFSKSGYAFGGWNTRVDGSGTNYTAGSSYTVTGNITLYAKWDTSYTVTFNVNGGSGTAPSAQTVSPYSAITLPFGSGLTKSGYTFGGWNTDADGMGTDFAAGFSYTVIGNITLYAKWDTVTNYTVTFDLNGGNGTAPSDQTVNAGTSATLPSGNGLTRSGYLFGGWNTNADGTGTNYVAGSSFTPTRHITLYAKWDTSYTITFNTNGLSGTAPTSQTVQPGYSITLPDRSVTYITFTGWNTHADGSGSHYAANSSYTPAGNISTIILYAQWEIIPLASITGLVNKLSWLHTYAQSDTSYTLEVDDDEIIYWDRVLSYNNRSNITLILRGVGSNRTISFARSPTVSTDRLLTVSNGVTLILDNNITLESPETNLNSLVRINSGGTFIMNNGSTITRTSYTTVSSSFNGGGVYVEGTFTMSGGTISGNTAHGGDGGGVYVSSNGTFTMNGGTISGNTAHEDGGGGVYVSNNGTFTMNDGTISGNTANIRLNGDGGGGVYVEYSGTFTMNGGTISGNKASSRGNISSSYSSGGGVYVGGTFTMSGGTISGNTPVGRGSNSSGGGVYVGYRGIFNKTGGTIYGYNNGTDNDNIVKQGTATLVGDIGNLTIISDRGHAVYAWDGSFAKRMETTAGPGVNLSFNKGQFSGNWDY